ncbi:MAG: family 16 glycoside hydrolase [Pirellulaceae bacterium]|nr:family 16 glycoside hydrolase [Pirellulaceae bacterium]
MRPPLLLPAILAIFVLPIYVQAEKGADLQPTNKGKVVLAEKFDGSTLGEGWTAAKGTWGIQDGAVIGREKATDNHAAVLAIAKSQANGAVRFSFNLDGASAFNLSFNYSQGHLFRVIVTPTSLVLQKDKDKKDPNSKAAALAQADGKFTPGEWHTLLVEMQGDKVTVLTDSGFRLVETDPAFKIAKTGPRFVMKGDKLLLDDLTIWQGE